MKIGQLRYLIAAAENGSFRRDAEALHVEQSSISRAISQLEDDLVVSLFERRYTGSYLTDAGKRLLRETKPALEQLDLAEKRAAVAGRAEVGVVRVGILTEDLAFIFGLAGETSALLRASAPDDWHTADEPGGGHSTHAILLPWYRHLAAAPTSWPSLCPAHLRTGLQGT